MTFFICLYILLGFLELFNSNACFISYSHEYSLCFAIPLIRCFTSDCKNHTENLDPYFVTGLTEAEGCFSITKHKDPRAKFGLVVGLRFKITMLVNEAELIEKVRSFFGFGTISNNKNGSMDFLVRDLNNLYKIRDHFLKYPFRGSKYLDFLSFVSAIDIFEQKTNRTEEGVKSLVNLSETMNKFRKDYSNFPPLHTIKSNPEFIPVCGHYISGFIAGDGALYLRTKSNFGSMGIQISQHITNTPLMREIADFFKPDIAVSPHGKESVQITIGGTKLWKNIISKHFISYPLHGTKKVRLTKLQEIASYLDSGAHLEKVGRTRVFKPESKEYIFKIWNS